jgi:predicted  nucleic acid-binding Zn-ribbon protein
VAQLRNTKEQLEIHCEELDREISRINAQYEAQQLELMKGVDERDAQLARLNEAFARLQERHAGLEREKQSLEGNLSERSARLEALTGAISDLENSIRRASDLTRPF